MNLTKTELKQMIAMNLLTDETIDEILENQSIVNELRRIYKLNEPVKCWKCNGTCEAVVGWERTDPIMGKCQNCENGIEISQIYLTLQGILAAHRDGQHK